MCDHYCLPVGVCTRVLVPLIFSSQSLGHTQNRCGVTTKLFSGHQLAINVVNLVGAPFRVWMPSIVRSWFVISSWIDAHGVVSGRVCGLLRFPDGYGAPSAGRSAVAGKQISAY